MTSRKKRPRDANQLAKSIVDIATGEIVDRPEQDGKHPAAGHCHVNRKVAVQLTVAASVHAATIA